MTIFPKRDLVKLYVAAGYSKLDAEAAAQRIVDLREEEENLRQTREILYRGLMEELQKQILFPKSA